MKNRLVNPLNVFTVIVLNICFSCSINRNNLTEKDSKMNSGKTVTSQFFVDSIYSENLKENRLLTIYLPKNHNPKLKYPVVYTTDGQLITDSYKKSIDSLIDNNIIPKVVIIGVNSNETFLPKMGVEYRNFDYVKNLHGGKDSLNLRFYKHFDFFSKEVMDYAEKKYSVSSDAKDRVFFGASNGADFGVTLALEKPSLIKTYIYCSIVAGSKDKFNWTIENAPFFYITCGNKEDEDIQNESRLLDKYLVTNNINHELFYFDGGHERKMWEATFIKTLPKVFKK